MPLADQGSLPMSRSTLRARALFGLVALVLGFSLIPDAPAQVKLAQPTVPVDKKKEDGKKEKPKSNFTDAFQLEIDRDASNKLEAVRQYMQKSDPPWDIIIQVLQKLLEDKKDTFVEIEYDDPKNPGKKLKNRVSVKQEVNRIIGAFPQAGRQFYQLTYGQAAEKRLREANDENDKGKLAEVAERFLHTKAGAEATVRLGTWHLDRGRYIMAALTFQKLQLRNQEDPLPPSVLFQAAVAFKRLGDVKEGETYWKKFKDALGGKTELAVGPKKFTMEQLQAEYDRVAVGQRLIDQADWYMSPGGGLTRNARGIGGRPFLEPRFSYSMMPIIHEQDERNYKAGMDWIKQNLEIALKQFDQRTNVPLPAFFPVASNGRVVFRTYDGVYCLSTKDDVSFNPPMKAGELLWRVECEHSL